MIITRRTTGHSFGREPLGFYVCSGCTMTISEGADAIARQFPTCLLYGLELRRRRLEAQRAIEVNPAAGGAA